MHAQSQFGEGTDRRKAFRCPALGPDQIVLLVLNRTEVPVQLVDESATGFAVRMIKGPRIRRGDVVRLRTRAGLHEVAVTYVTDEEASESGETSAEDVGPIIRVGLERQGEVGARGDLFGGGLLGRLRMSGPGATIMLCLLVVTAVVGVAYVGTLVWLTHDTSSRIASPGRDSQSPSMLNRILDGQDARSSQQPATWMRSGSHGDPSAGNAVGGAIDSPAGAAIFGQSQIARQLGLSEAQKKTLLDIVAATEQVERQMREERAGRSPEEERQLEAELLQQAHKEALGVLTEKQRAIWQSMKQ